MYELYNCILSSTKIYNIVLNLYENPKIILEILLALIELTTRIGIFLKMNAFRLLDRWIFVFFNGHNLHICLQFEVYSYSSYIHVWSNHKFSLSLGKVRPLPDPRLFRLYGEHLGKPGFNLKNYFLKKFNNSKKIKFLVFLLAFWIGPWDFSYKWVYLKI